MPLKKLKSMELVVQQWMDNKITLEEACKKTGKSAPTIRHYAKRIWAGEVIKQK